MNSRRCLTVPVIVAGLTAVACTTSAGEAGPPLTSAAANDHAMADAPVPSPAADGPRTTAQQPTSPPWLIKHGWDVPRPPFVERNVASMEQRGFDGVVIQIESSGDVLSRKPVSYERLRAELSPLRRARFTTMTHNFVIVYSGDLGGYEADWTVAESNVANLARAAREAGLQGIVYDNENYEGVLWDWKANESPTPLPEAEETVMVKGRNILTALESQWPDATLIALIGPWVSHASTADHFDGHFVYNDVAWANELIGPFFLRMASAVVGTDITLVDGGEVYTPRSDRDFRHAYDWLNGGMTAAEDLLTEPLRAGYAEAVSVGFGVFDRPLPDAPMDPDIWRDTLANALRTTDHYVWAYTELHDWWGTGWPKTPVPDEFVRATAATLPARGR